MSGSLTWLGDTDPNAVAITEGGVTFVKGESVNVKDKALFERLSGNPLFSAEKSAKEVEADQPDADALAARAEEGTEKAALKARLRELGVTVQGNPSVETLRGKLVDATK